MDGYMADSMLKTPHRRFWAVTEGDKMCFCTRLYPYGYAKMKNNQNYTFSGANLRKGIDIIPVRVYNVRMNTIAIFIKQKRKEAGLTQEEFAIRSGLGLRFVRELEQGKETVRMDKVNQALAMFGMEAVPGRKDEK